MTLKLNDCGKHYGNGGPCSKCTHTAKQSRKGLQYTGTPWIAVLQEPESLQERAIRKAGEYQTLGLNAFDTP